MRKKRVKIIEFDIHDYKPVIESIILKYPEGKTSLISILQDIQATYNYLPQQALKLVSKKLNIPISEIYGVATFYSQFSLTPRGKHHISVCMGTACYVKGALNLLNALKEQLDIEVNECTSDGLFSLTEARCLGCCGLAPVIMVDDKVYNDVKTTDINKIIDSYK